MPAVKEQQPGLMDFDKYLGQQPGTMSFQRYLPTDPQEMDLPTYKPEWKQGPIPDVNAIIRERAMRLGPDELSILDKKRSRFDEWVDAGARGFARTASGLSTATGEFISTPTYKTMGGLRRFPLSAQELEKQKELANKFRAFGDLMWAIQQHPELVSQNTDLLSQVLNMGAETIPYITVTTIGTLAAGPFGGFAVGSMVEGNDAYRSALDAGVDEEKAKAIGISVGVICGAIESVGGRVTDRAVAAISTKIRNSAIRGAADISMGSLTEAMEETFQEWTQMGGELKYRHIDCDEAVRRSLVAAGGGGLLGGVFKTGSASIRGISTQPKPFEATAQEKMEWLLKDVRTEEDVDRFVDELKKSLVEEGGEKPLAEQIAAPAQPEQGKPMRMEQAGGIATENVVVNLYTGNMTPRVKRVAAEMFGVPVEEIDTLRDETGKPVKRIKTQMTRAEAGNYLQHSIEEIDRLAESFNLPLESQKELDEARAIYMDLVKDKAPQEQQIAARKEWQRIAEEVGKSLNIDMNTLSKYQATIGDIKALQDALGFAVQPAQITFKQEKKRKYAVVGESIISQERFDEINKRIKAGEELTGQDKADLFIALREEAAVAKATTEIHTTKQLIESALRPDKLETIEISTLELFNRVMKGRSQEAQHAYIAGARDTVKQHKDLAAEAKSQLKGLPVSEGQRNQILNAIARARTDSERIVAQASVESVIEKATKQQAVRDFKETRKGLHKKFGTKKTQFGQMRPEFESRMNELLDGIDDTALSSAKESDLLGLQEKIHGLAAELQKEAMAFNNDPDLRNEAVRDLLGIPDQRIKELGRLSKTPLKDMTAGDINGLTREMSRIVGMNNLKNKLIEKGRIKSLNDSLAKITGELVPTKKALEGKDISASIPKKLLKDNTATMPTHIHNATGSLNNESSQYLLWDILDGMSERYQLERRIRSHFTEQMKQKKITYDDIKRWSNTTHTYEMHGKTYQLNETQLLSLLMHMRNPENRAAVQCGLLIREKLPMGGTQTVTIGKDIGNGQYSLSLKDIGTLLDPIYTDKHIAMADIANDLLDNVLRPTLSQASVDIYGSDMFRVINYWAMHRALPRSMGGAKQQLTPLSERGFTFERVGGKQPIYLMPFFNQLLDSVESGAMYAKMMSPIFNAKSLVTSAKWQDAMIKAGRRDEMNLIMDKLSTLEGNVTSSDVLAQASGFIRRGYAAHALLLNFSSIAAQLTSEPMLISADPDNYLKSVISYDRQLQEEIDKHNGLFWKRSNFGRTTKEIGDVRSTDGADEFFFGKRSPQGNMMRLQAATDSMVIQKVWKMAKLYVDQSQPGIKHGSNEYWSAVNRRAFELSLTQPNWEPFLRSAYLTSSSPFTGGMMLFRSPLEAMLNVVMRNPASFKSWGAVGASLLAYRVTKEYYYDLVKSVPRWFGRGKKEDETPKEKLLDASEQLIYDASRVHPIGILLEPALRIAIDAYKNRPSQMKFGRGNIYGMTLEMTNRMIGSLTKGLRLKSEGKDKQAWPHLKEAGESAAELLTIIMRMPYVGIATPLRQWFGKDKGALDKQVDRMEVMMENIGTEDIENQMEDFLERF